MSEETRNTVLDYANQKFATETPTKTSSETVIVPETSVETVADNVATTEIVETATTNAITNTEILEPPVVDYSKFLSENSDGMFTDVDTFKASLPKLKEYDTLLSTKNELEEKLKVDPFVNDYVKTIDSMIRSGKTADEIENFTKVSKLDIDQLSAVDVKVMVMVKNGYSEAIAKQIVQRDFPIDDYEEGSAERAIVEEELRVSSLDDRKVLKEYKRELTTIDTTAQEQQEANRLAVIAQTEAHAQTVKQSIPKIAETIMGLGEANLNGKEGDEAVKLNFDYNDEFKASIPEKLESFFLDGQMPLNDENIALANGYIQADYLQKNFINIAQSIFKHAHSLATEATVNKYENRTGLPAESTSVVVDNTQKEYAEFLSKVAKGS